MDLFRGPGSALAFAALLALAPPPAERFAPLTFAVLEDYDKGDDLDDVARDFDLLRQLGVRTWRGSFGWDDFEPEPGRYDFAWLHRFVDLAASRGVTLRPYLGYTPSWAAGGTDKDTQAWNQPPKSGREWSAFVGAIARELRHHPNVPSLEIFNEENVPQWWEGSRDEYARTLAEAGRAARRQRRFQILPGGLVFPDTEWVETVCGHSGVGPSLDAIAVHAYPETWTPPDVTVENYFGPGFERDFVAAVDRACGRKPVWVNETGFATTPGKTERQQAAWWIRAVASFAARPRIEQIGIYEIKDLAAQKAAIGDAPNYHLGITRVDRTPKLAFGTLRRLVEIFGSRGRSPADGDVSVTPLDDSGELHHHAFRLAEGRRALFIWNRTADQRVTLAASAAATATEYGLDGSIAGQPALPLTITLQAGIPRMFVWTLTDRGAW